MRILPVHLAQAIRALGAMDLARREHLADELFARQPNLLASVLVLHRMGADSRDIETALHALLVSWLAMKASGASWPVVTEAMQRSCLQHLTARTRFCEGLRDEQYGQVAQQYIDDHPEPHLLAFVNAHLQENGLRSRRSDSHGQVVLVALNLVECIAHAAPRGEP